MEEHTGTHKYLVDATRDILRTYMGAVGTEIAERLKTLNAAMPAILAGRPADNQISWGITRRHGEFKVIILAENDADPLVQEIVRTSEAVFVTRLTAEAHSLDARVSHLPRSPSLPDRKAGASIGHMSGYPGTLGCFVRCTEGNWLGVISASHVLGRNNRSRRGDKVLSPGPADGRRTLNEEIGTLQNFKLLPHFQCASDNYLCCEDIALVKVEDTSDIPDVTEVWSPDRPNILMPIQRVIGGEDVANRLGQRVYKMGRTTGLTSGILDIVGLQRQRIVVANSDPAEAVTERHYIYTNILAVQCDKGPFSRAGDSGALVYTADGCGIGLVIAGTEQYSFVSPLDACLRDMKATIL
ncbi:hypothetical protein BjapCC829_23815 [Bradyrhizobium barranii]|uniref:Trypsin-like peptidase n=1 Tax=Bradyrhizobium barranii TaxID=2992140 RepID=A0ABY3QB10_9BRAD|nr:hypothetical protein [Bradyrhizobium japonicum]UFW83013.1 hypothetical protein BjapCC829_23815 [Bradyrhizobium japonicum]